MARSQAAKTHGRIFVSKQEDVEVVKKMIEKVDDFEFEYMPDNVVAVFGEDDELVYLGKFEIDINALARACMEVSAKHVTAFADSQKSSRVMKDTARLKIREVLKWLEWLASEGVLKKNPAADLDASQLAP